MFRDAFFFSFVCQKVRDYHLNQRLALLYVLHEVLRIDQGQESRYKRVVLHSAVQYSGDYMRYTPK